MMHSENPSGLAPGMLLKHYHLISRIGSGGMGEVFLAEDIKLNRQVALKFMPADMARNRELRALFTQEARAAAHVSHPNIVAVYEVSDFHERPFIVMEHVEGQTLDERLKQGPLPIGDVLDIAAQTCEGLKAAHDHGITHRDIKPSNIKLDHNGRVRLLDFGLARIEGDARLTHDESFAGTVSYMSPEQVQGEPTSPASDLFALGTVIYEMTTGELPFKGDYEASVIYSIVNNTPEAIATLRPDAPPGLVRIVDKLLQKRPDDRYRDVSEVIADLRELSTKTYSDATFAVKDDKRHRRATLTALSVLALAAVVLVGPHLFRKYLVPDNHPKIVAVLPFENKGDAEDEYFADGMTDEITTNLAKFHDLRVISRASSMKYKQTEKDIRQIGDELGATYVLTGSVYWDRSTRNNRVRIYAKLVRVDDDTYLWGDTYDRSLKVDRLFDAQSEIAKNVTTALKVAMTEADEAQLASVPTRNLEAYQLYLRGNQYFNRSWDREDIQIATQMYEHAVARDSTFALAWAMLSRGHESMYWEYFDRNEERCQEARVAAQRALALSPGLAEGHLALGYCFYHCEMDYIRALEEFNAALDRSPNNADLYSAVAAVQRREGLLGMASSNFVTAFELDPRSQLKAFDVALTYGMMREYDRATAYLDTTLAITPDWPLPYVYKAWLYIFRAGDTARARVVLAGAAGRADLVRSPYYWWLSRIVETDYQKVLNETRPGADTVGYFLHVAQLNRLLGRHDIEYAYSDSARQKLLPQLQAAPDDARFHSRLGLAYAGLRQADSALVHSGRAVELLPTSRDAFDALFLVVNLAETQVIFGRYDEAIGQLRFLLSIPGFVSVPYLKLDPLWQPLRDEPEFKKLLSQES